MTEPQFRSWYENKLRGASARAKYLGGSWGPRMRKTKKPLPHRFKVPALIADLESILDEAKQRARSIPQNKGRKSTMK